jgi:hypothetical protein
LEENPRFIELQSLVRGIVYTEIQGREGLMEGLIVKQRVYLLIGPVLEILRISI